MDTWYAQTSESSCAVHLFARQGELLCTQALAYLLQNDEARTAFAEYVSGRTGVELKRDLTCRAEVRQLEDLGRPDLEGCSTDKQRVVKIEGKLGADLGPGQLRSYVMDLERRCRDGLLLVLVPRRRQQDATAAIAAALAVSGGGPSWRLPSGCVLALIFWEDAAHCAARDPLRALPG